MRTHWRQVRKKVALSYWVDHWSLSLLKNFTETVTAFFGIPIKVQQIYGEMKLVFYCFSQWKYEKLSFRIVHFHHKKVSVGPAVLEGNKNFYK